jgi:hypothetical protein
MTASDDHGTLPVHAERMLRRLETIENLAVTGETAHMQHMDHAKRVRQLAHHLRAVLLLSEAHHYPSALVVVRSALEHHLMDRLIFLANRYIVTHTTVKKKDVPSWDLKLAAAQAGDQPDIATWFWDQSGMNVVRRGFHSGKSKKGRGQTISSYYFQVDDFDPFAGPKKYAGRLAAPFWERKHTQQWADESASAWRYLFRHDAVMKALRVNRLLLGRHMQVDGAIRIPERVRPPVEARLRGDLRRELARSVGIIRSLRERDRPPLRHRPRRRRDRDLRPHGPTSTPPRPPRLGPSADGGPCSATRVVLLLVLVGQARDVRSNRHGAYAAGQLEAEVGTSEG